MDKQHYISNLNLEYIDYQTVINSYEKLKNLRLKIHIIINLYHYI